MKTIKKILQNFAVAALVLIPFFSFSQNTPAYNWVLPPYQIHFSGSGSPTSTSLPSTTSGYSTSPPTNGAYDAGNNLLFFVAGGNVFNGNGSFVNALPSANIGGNIYDVYPGGTDQTEIVPVPGTCQNFYVIYPVLYNNPPAAIYGYMYVTVTCSGGTVSVSPTATQTSGPNVIVTQLVTGNPLSSAMAVSRIDNGLTGASATRSLYIVSNVSSSNNQILKYTISSTGIAAAATPVVGKWNYVSTGLRVAQASLDYTSSTSTKLAWSCGSSLYVLNLSTAGPINTPSTYTFPSGYTPLGVAFDVYGNIFANTSAGIYKWSASSSSFGSAIITNSSTYGNSQLAVARDGVLSGGTYVNHIYAVSSSGTLGYIDPSVASPSVTASPLSVTLSTITPPGGGGFYLLPSVVDGENYSNFFGLATPNISLSPTSGSVCAGNSILLTSSTTSGTPYYYWYQNSISNANYLVGSAGQTSYTAIPTSNTTYIVEVQNPTTLCTSYASAAVTVNPLPNISISPLNPSICAGNGTTLESSTTSGSLYYWWYLNSISSANYIGGSAGATAYAAYPSATTTYVVQVQNPTTLCTSSASSTVTVNPLPNITLSPVNPSVCNGIDVTLTASTTSGSLDYWWYQNSISNPNYIGGSAGKTTLTFLPPQGATLPQSTTYYVEVENPTTLCVSSASTVVTVNNCQKELIVAGDPASLMNAFNIYPNPTTSAITIDYSSVESAVYSYRIFDILGNEVVVSTPLSKEAGDQKTNVNVSQLTAGVYICELIGEQTYRTKFVKQ